MRSKETNKRKPRSICFNERELETAENIMHVYRLHSISDAVRFSLSMVDAFIHEMETAESAGK